MRSTNSVNPSSEFTSGILVCVFLLSLAKSFVCKQFANCFALSVNLSLTQRFIIDSAASSGLSRQILLTVAPFRPPPRSPAPPCLIFSFSISTAFNHSSWLTELVEQKIESFCCSLITNIGCKTVQGVSGCFVWKYKCRGLGRVGWCTRSSTSAPWPTSAPPTRWTGASQSSSRTTV